MATLSLSDISDALSQLFEPAITSQINSVAVGLNVIPTIMGGGKNAAWTVKFSGRANAAGFVEGADMVAGDFDQEIKVDAVLPWAQYRKGAALSGLAQAAAASNQQPGSILSEGSTDAMDEEIGDAVERMALGLGSDLYAGDGSGANPLIGLAAAVDAGAALYATIDPAVRTEWVSTEQTVATASLSFEKIRALLRAIYVASGKKPDLLLTDPATFDAIGQLFGDNRPFTQEIVLSDGSAMGRRTITFEAGYTALFFDGIPVVQDVLCTANTLYALNTRFLHVRQLPAYKSPMTQERFLDLMEGITGERLPDSALGEHQAAPGSLKPYVEMIGKTGDSDKAQIKVYAQLCVKRRNAQGKLTLT